MKSRLSITLTMLLITLSVLASPVPTQAIMLVSRSQEIEIGKQVQRNIINAYGGLDRDPAVAQRVAVVGKNVAAMSPRQGINYTYQVLNSRVINAFAAPGGPVLITRGLADLLTKNDELAFVLAHETGHIASEHGRDAINRTLIAQGLATLLFRRSSSVVQTGINVVYTLYDRGYSRNQEYQADSYGLQLMTNAGYNSEGSIKALAKLGTKRTSGLDRYLATHPDVPNRINRVQQMAGIPPARAQELIKEAQQEQ